MEGQHGSISCFYIGLLYIHSKDHAHVEVRNRVENITTDVSNGILQSSTTAGLDIVRGTESRDTLVHSEDFS